jgi:hypothetical protein
MYRAYLRPMLNKEAMD